MSRIASAVRVLLGAAALALSGAPAQAQTFPSKPIRLVLPYVPGGIIDNVGRNLAQRLGENLGQTVVAENRPGAGGMVGTDVVARSAPDGYTILLTDPALVSNPTLQKDAPYELAKLQAISIVGSSPAVIVASLHLPVKTFAELLAYAKANPGKLNFASAGIGTAPHLAGEMIKLRTGIDMAHVPYRGIGAAYPDVMSGKVQLAFPSIAGAVPLIGHNRGRPIAVTGTGGAGRSGRADGGGICPDLTSTCGPASTARRFRRRCWRAGGEINKALRIRMRWRWRGSGRPRGTTPRRAPPSPGRVRKWKVIVGRSPGTRRNRGCREGSPSTVVGWKSVAYAT